MHTNQVPLVVLAAALSASAMESELLNSERIERRFGSYAIDVITAQPGLRRSNLYSNEEHDRICRTYAVVKFADQTSGEVSEEHSRVLAGGSIGAVFKANGWEIVKGTLYLGEILAVDAGSDIGRLMHLEDPQDLAVHIYRLSLRKDDVSIDYATIIESHHPDYLTQADLKRLYPTSNDLRLDDAAVAEFVELVLLPEEN
jgi:hypothetical protein